MALTSHLLMKHPLVHALRDFLHQESIHEGTLLAAVSGGPDSMALLHGLHLLAEAQTLRLLVGHLNHQLRGAESDADEALVEKTCVSLPCPCVVQRVCVAEMVRKKGANLEAEARRLRYAFLTELANERQVRWIATGHQLNDQAETVLHHLLRGTGLRGLRGIAPKRSLGRGVDVLRPLLYVTREQILDFLDQGGFAFREDASNQDLRWTRNRIRHEILPRLRERFGASVDVHLSQWADQAREWQACWVNWLKPLWQRVERPRAGAAIVLDANALAAEPPAVQRELLHQLWEREHWPLRDMTHLHWQRLLGVLSGSPTAADFPGPIHIRRQDHMLVLDPRLPNFIHNADLPEI